jgi:hypothetical protein
MRKAIKSLGASFYHPKTTIDETKGIERFSCLREQLYGSVNIHEHKVQAQQPRSYVLGSHIPFVGSRPANGGSILSSTERLMLPNRVLQLYADMTGRTL